LNQTLLADASLPAVLFEIDRGLAEEARLKGCGACGAVVHVADYPRKVRGSPWRLDETHDRRLSFCCSRPGCRKRLTPPSVRFAARRDDRFLAPRADNSQPDDASSAAMTAFGRHGRTTLGQTMRLAPR
jgi:hypothetical protein